MENRLKAGQTVELSTQDNPDKESYKVRVEEIVSNEEIIIEVPIIGGKALIMHNGSKFRLTYFEEASMFVQEVSVITRFLSGSVVSARLLLEGKAKRFNRRQYFRMPVLIDGFTQVEKDPFKPMTTTNLSAGGIRFVSLETFKAEDAVRVKINIKNTELILEGTVISCGMVKDSIRRHDVRVKFDSVNSREERVIMAYLFEQQRAIKKKGLA